MDDRWIAISIESDDEWLRLVTAMGSPAWAADPRFAANEGRAQHYKEIDRHIAGWTATRDDYEMMHLLQAAGVAAMPVLEVSRAFDDPQFIARGFFRDQTVEGAGTRKYGGPLWQFPETPVEFRQPPVLFGEHNEYVYRELLGYSDDEIERFRQAGVVTMEYDESVP